MRIAGRGSIHMTQITKLKPGDTVRFTFGCTDTELFGTLRRFTTDRSGRPAALIGVAGFPDWLHVEPLESVSLAEVGRGLARLLFGAVPSSCTANCNQGRACTCEREEVAA